MPREPKLSLRKFRKFADDNASKLSFWIELPDSALPLFRKASVLYIYSAAGSSERRI